MMREMERVCDADNNSTQIELKIERLNIDFGYVILCCAIHTQSLPLNTLYRILFPLSHHSCRYFSARHHLNAIYSATSHNLQQQQQHRQQKMSICTPLPHAHRLPPKNKQQIHKLIIIHEKTKHSCAMSSTAFRSNFTPPFLLYRHIHKSSELGWLQKIKNSNPRKA